MLGKVDNRRLYFKIYLINTVIDSIENNVYPQCFRAIYSIEGINWNTRQLYKCTKGYGRITQPFNL